MTKTDARWPWPKTGEKFAEFVNNSLTTMLPHTTLVKRVEERPWGWTYKWGQSTFAVVSLPEGQYFAYYGQPSRFDPDRVLADPEQARSDAMLAPGNSSASIHRDLLDLAEDFVLQMT